MFRDTHMGSSSPKFEHYQFDGPVVVGKMLDRDCDVTPDSRPGVIAFRCSLLGTLEGIRLGLASGAIDHQHRHPPDLDLPHHAENGSMLVF